LIDDTYACRCGKGRHRAVLRAQAFCRRYRYCLKTDIRRYYDRVDHWIKETRGALGYVRYMDAKFGRQLKTPHPTRRSARTE